MSCVLPFLLKVVCSIQGIFRWAKENSPLFQGTPLLISNHLPDLRVMLLLPLDLGHPANLTFLDWQPKRFWAWYILSNECSVWNLQNVWTGKWEEVPELASLDWLLPGRHQFLGPSASNTHVCRTCWLPETFAAPGHSRLGSHTVREKELEAVCEQKNHFFFSSGAFSVVALFTIQSRIYWMPGH